ncbi:common pilus major fimbrillin subunit EcpA [Acinetobacter rudis]|uniref:common pilus major fimbrillin subunit EcpA n=1 Tax=Acinetobacter rudis TaxID=632955 RepID=UPI0033402060
MKKYSLFIISCFVSINIFAENITSSATAKWQTSAFKDTSSTLVITPLSSLNFQYAEGSNSFSKEYGKFNITLMGLIGSTDFKLTSKVISDELVRFDDPSKLKVAIQWHGQELSKTQETVLISTGDGVHAGLTPLAQKEVYAGHGRDSAQADFGFSIKNAMNTTGQNTDFTQLKDGTWNGEVAVQFTATWAKP